MVASGQLLDYSPSLPLLDVGLPPPLLSLRRALFILCCLALGVTIMFEYLPEIIAEKNCKTTFDGHKKNSPFHR